MYSTAQSTPATALTPPWVDKVLSADRFRTYLLAAGFDCDLALQLHRWNFRISQALLGDLWLIELGLRNAIAPRLQTIADSRGLGAWYSPTAAESLFPGDRQRITRETIGDAVGQAGGYAAPSGRVVAELPFGFWVHMLDGRKRDLWDGGLKGAFPAGTERGRVRETLYYLKDQRNRMSHLEPMLTADFQLITGRARHVAKLIDPTFARYLVQQSIVPQVLAMRPKASKRV